MMAAIALSSVNFAYDPVRPVLQRISLDIPTGSLTAILGPNGSGKSTLLHVLLGLIHPQQGVVTIAGKPLADYTRRELGQTIGLVPQNEHIPFDFTLLDYVLLGRAPHLGALEQPRSIDRQCALDALAQVGLGPLRNRAITRLSGGERQLAMIARALAQQPRILLLDEPTSHLDLANRRAVRDVMRHLTDRGVTVVLTSHDPHLVSDTADYLILLRGGILRAAGPTSELFTSEHLSATYDIPVQVASLDGQRVILA